MERFAGSCQEDDGQRKRKREETWAEERPCHEAKKRREEKKGTEEKQGGAKDQEAPGVYQALLPIFANSPPCSKSVQLTGKGRRGMVLCRVWK